VSRRGIGFYIPSTGKEPRWRTSAGAHSRVQEWVEDELPSTPTGARRRIFENAQPKGASKPLRASRSDQADGLRELRVATGPMWCGEQ
jgi:hypothetical protein